jgi:2-octaprenyl-6-methoxyphenol hydroxylase
MQRERRWRKLISMEQFGTSSGRIAVVGGGPAGLLAALLLEKAGMRISLFAPPISQPDPRTTALLGASVEALAVAGVWQVLLQRSAPLQKLRIADGTRRLLRAPEVLFDAQELQLDAFGYNIANEDLLAALRSAVGATPAIASRTDAVRSLAFGEPGVMLVLANGASEGPFDLVVAADGRNSICREAAEIRVGRRALPQSALALSFAHSRPHRNISTEFHTESGPFTLVPLPGMRSSLVWVCRSGEEEKLRKMPDAELNALIERKSAFILGSVRVDPPRGIFPLGVSLAETFAKNRVVLVGESGHVLPPIGAQGLNLGFRDAAALAKLAAASLVQSDRTAVASLLAAYDAERGPDIRARAIAVEMLGRSLLTGFLPVQFAKSAGLALAQRVPAFRQWLMQQGMGAGGERSGTG